MADVTDAVPLARVIRGELVESVHLGRLVLLPADGEPVVRGDGDLVIWPRSSLKPLQAVAMLRAGLDLPDRLLALAASSHNGEEVHREGVVAILDSVGLTTDALQNTPDLPWNAAAAVAWQCDGHGPDPLCQNCSGKHAAMLATCVAAGWDTGTYLDPGHPLQVAIAGAVAEFTAVPVPTATLDGCGAPLLATTTLGLARAFARLGAAPEQDPDSAEARVARAMSAFPELVAGSGRPATTAMRAVPGLVAKDGADGVFAAALPSGSAVAFKILDGGARPLPVVLARALVELGADPDALAELATRPVLGGGHPVGAVRPAW